MKIQFQCSNCKTKYSALPEHSGKEGTCKNCGTKIVVPKPEAETLTPETDLHSGAKSSNNLQAWLNHYRNAFQLSNKSFTSSEKEFLLQNYRKEDKQLQEQMLEMCHIMMKYFFDMATGGKTFGTLQETEADLGMSIESNYGLSDGPFIALAKTYWTFRYQVDQFAHEHHKKNILQILRYVEVQVENIFFGSQPMSKAQRYMRQEKILYEYAPKMDVKSFLSENPIIK